VTGSEAVLQSPSGTASGCFAGVFLVRDSTCTSCNRISPAMIASGTSSLIDIGTASGQGTCSRRDAYMSIEDEYEFTI